jgi:pectinesterase
VIRAASVVAEAIPNAGLERFDHGSTAHSIFAVELCVVADVRPSHRARGVGKLALRCIVSCVNAPRKQAKIGWPLACLDDTRHLMKMRSHRAAAPALFALLLAAACSTNDNSSGTGGTAGAGGSTGTGGGSTGGSNAGTGGTSAAGTGGTPGSGGAGTGTGTGGASGGGTGGISDAGASDTSTGTGGAAGGSSEGGLVLGGTATRPQLSSNDAANLTILSYLAKTGTVAAPTTDNWDPTVGIPDPAAPTITVGGATPTIQSAIDAAITMGGTNRIFILVPAGTYREVVCVGPLVANGPVPPITLYAADSDAGNAVIVYNNFSDQTRDGGAATNRCFAPGAATFGTDASATFGINAADFQAKNLTIANDTDETLITGGGTQGVALHTRGDKAIFQNVRFLGNQDTVEVKTPNVDTIRRSYFKGCYIEGDVDFIFGRGTAVFDGTEIHLVTNRRQTNGSMIAPSTDARNPFGFLIINGSFTAAANATAGMNSLGRAYDEGIAAGDAGSLINAYANVAAIGTFPNGQSLIRDTTIGAHINGTSPWQAAATSARPYSSTPTTAANGGAIPANRFYEFNNSGPGAAQ